MRLHFTMVLLASFIISAATAQNENKDLIVNGDLEGSLLGDGPLPKDWTLFSKPQGAYKAGLSDVAWQGKRSLQVEGDGEFAVVSALRLEIDDAFSHILRGRLKVEGDDAKATIKFDYFNKAGEWVGSTTVGDASAADCAAGDKGWLAVTLKDRPEIDGAKKAVTLSVGLALVGKGKAWFDDVSLEPVKRQAEPELVENGDFENSLGRTPARWWVGMADGGKATATLSDEKPKQGRHCLHFKGDAEWAVASCARIPFDPKKTYEVTGYVRTKAGSAQIKIDYFNGEEHLGSTYGEDVLDDEWTQRTLAATNEFENATHLAVTCVGTGEFDAKFDAITIQVK